MKNKRLQGIMVARLDQFSTAWDALILALAAMSPEDRAEALKYAKDEDYFESLIAMWRRESAAVAKD